MSRNPEKTSSPAGGKGFEPEVVVLYCQHCVTDNTNVTLTADRATGFSARLVEMACSSKIEVHHILKILEEGVDAVVVVACPESKCRFLVGSLRAEKRIRYIRRLLDEINLGPERLGISRSEGLSAKKLMDLAADRARTASTLGPNPMKKGVL